MTPIGIWNTENAIENALTAPAPRFVASEVATRKVSWLAPSPTARGTIRMSAWRADGSPRSIRGVQRNPVCRSGRSWTPM